MAQPLDVLLIEGPTPSSAAADALAASGHRVHRCYGPDDPSFPCVAVTEPAACPIDRGVDVALLVRHRVNPRPTPLEGAVTCAIRAGVPIVEDGPAILDPFEPWLTARVDGSVSRACDEAAAARFEPLRHDVAGRMAALLHAASIDPGSVDCSVDAGRTKLHLRLRGPSVPRRLEQALAVRALDAVRAFGPNYDKVNVSYETTNG